jgi:hypothetical protein
VLFGKIKIFTMHMYSKKVILISGSSRSSPHNDIASGNSLASSVFVSTGTGNSTAAASAQIAAPNTESARGDLASINASRSRGGRNSSTRVIINTNGESK